MARVPTSARPGAFSTVSARNTFEGALHDRVAAIVGFRTRATNAAGRVAFKWTAPGDVLPFELTVHTKEPKRVDARLHTNANHNEDPSAFEDLRPTWRKANGPYVTFGFDVPIQKLGSYRATAKILVDDEVAQWASAAGLGDIPFRPRAAEHNAMNMVEIPTLNLNSNGHGTFEDLLDSGTPATGGKYTLEHLQNQGVNALWVMPPFKRSRPGPHPDDDAGSPYAAKNFKQIEPTLSRRAMALQAQGASEEEVARAANEAWKQFVDQAHARGMKVIVDIALNHVGHNYELPLKDYARFFEADSPLAAQVAARLADPNLPDVAEQIAPEILYASRTGDRRGAQSVHDTMFGGGQWNDTKQLKTGGPYGPPHPEGADAVIDWLCDVVESLVLQGVDGFRLDHMSGLPARLTERVVNRAQAASDRARGGTPIYVVGEDFADPAGSANLVDDIQDNWLRSAVRGGNIPATLRGMLLDDHYKRELITLNSHDEHAFDFHGDLRAAGRMNAVLQLLGHTNLSVATDEFFRRDHVPFKQHRLIPEAQHPSAEQIALAETFARAGRARLGTPVLQDDVTEFLAPATGGEDPDLFAAARLPHVSGADAPVVLFANFNNTWTRENQFLPDFELAGQLDPEARYQVRDLLAQDPTASLWEQPKTGRELIDGGIYARLEPYQVQALQLSRV